MYSYSKNFLIIFFITFNPSSSYCEEQLNSNKASNQNIAEEESISDIKKILSEDDPRHEEEKVQISKRYKTGTHLIYDCSKRHFACVDKFSFKDCFERRKLAIDLKSSNLLPCVPLVKYKNPKICHEAQYLKQHRRRNKSFCLLDSTH